MPFAKICLPILRPIWPRCAETLHPPNRPAHARELVSGTRLTAGFFIRSCIDGPVLMRLFGDGGRRLREFRLLNRGRDIASQVVRSPQIAPEETDIAV